jgi:hypothetical protein
MSIFICMKLLIEDELRNYSLGDNEESFLKVMWNRYKKFFNDGMRGHKLDSGDPEIDRLTKKIFNQDSDYGSALEFETLNRRYFPKLSKEMLAFFNVILRKTKNTDKPIYVTKVYTKWVWYAKKKDTWHTWEDIYLVFKTTPGLTEGEFHAARHNNRLRYTGCYHIKGDMSHSNVGDKTREFVVLAEYRLQ